MVQQGGLGRGLASLIPKKNNNKNKTRQFQSGKNGINSEEKIVKDNSIGETNYFGGFAKNSKNNNRKTGKKNESILKKQIRAERTFSLRNMMEVGTDEVVPNPYQPRTNFDQIKLQELADSIAEHGIIQPLVVSYGKNRGYELIAGERRLEAAKLAGLEKVPVVTKNATEQNKAEWALIENIQRHNLNPIEEANAYQKIKDKFSLTQDEIAKKVGRSRSAVANILRLLKLPQEIQDALVAGKITEGHARTILAINNIKKQMDLFRLILRDKLNVRQVENTTKGIKLNKNFKLKTEVDPDLLNLENQIADNLKTKVKIRGIKNNGKILIDYYSEEELGEIVKKIRGE